MPIAAQIMPKIFYEIGHRSFCPWLAFPSYSNIYRQGRSLPGWSTFQLFMLRVLIPNIRLGWKVLPGTNGPSFLASSSATKKATSAPDACRNWWRRTGFGAKTIFIFVRRSIVAVAKLFFSVVTDDKLERLSLPKYFGLVYYFRVEHFNSVPTRDRWSPFSQILD